MDNMDIVPAIIGGVVPTVTQELTAIVGRGYSNRKDLPIRRLMSRLVRRVTIEGWTIKMMEVEGVSDNEISTLLTEDERHMACEFNEKTSEAVSSYLQKEIGACINLKAISDDIELSNGYPRFSKPYQEYEDFLLTNFLADVNVTGLRKRTGRSNLPSMPRRIVAVQKALSRFFGKQYDANADTSSISEYVTEVYTLLGLDGDGAREDPLLLELSSKELALQGAIDFYLQREVDYLSDEFSMWILHENRSADRLRVRVFWSCSGGFTGKQETARVKLPNKDDPEDAEVQEAKELLTDAHEMIMKGVHKLSPYDRDLLKLLAIPGILRRSHRGEPGHKLSGPGAAMSLVCQVLSERNVCIDSKCRRLVKLARWLTAAQRAIISDISDVDERSRKMFSTLKTMQLRMLNSITDSHALGYSVRDKIVRSLTGIDLGRMQEPGPYEFIETLIPGKRTLSDLLERRALTEARKRNIKAEPDHIGLDQLWCATVLRGFRSNSNETSIRISSHKSQVFNSTDSTMITDPASRTIFHYYKPTKAYDKRDIRNDVQPFVSEREISAELVMSVLLTALRPGDTEGCFEVAKDMLNLNISKSAKGVFNILDAAQEDLEDNIYRNSASWMTQSCTVSGMVKEIERHTKQFSKQSQAWITREVVCRYYMAGVNLVKGPNVKNDFTCLAKVLQNSRRVRGVVAMVADIPLPLRGTVVHKVSEQLIRPLQNRRYEEIRAAVGDVLLAVRTKGCMHAFRGRVAAPTTNQMVLDGDVSVGWIISSSSQTSHADD